MKKLSAILAFVLVLLTFTACGSAGYEKTIENYYKAIVNEDAQKFMDLYANDDYIDYLIKDSKKDEDKENDLDDEDDVLDIYEDRVKARLKNYEDEKEGEGLGKNIKYDVEVSSVRKFHKDDVAALAEYLDDKGYEKETVQDVVYVSYTCRLTGDEGSYRENRGSIVLKVSGKWYLTTALSGTDSVLKGIIEGYDDDGLKAAFNNSDDYYYYE